MSRPRKPDAPPRPVDPMIAVLRDARRERKMSQLTLALEIGATQRAVAAWEIGTNPPDLSMLRRWTALLGLDMKLTGVLEEPADVVYARGWDDCTEAMHAATTRGSRA